MMRLKKIQHSGRCIIGKAQMQKFAEDFTKYSQHKPWRVRREGNDSHCGRSLERDPKK